MRTLVAVGLSLCLEANSMAPQELGRRASFRLLAGAPVAVGLQAGRVPHAGAAGLDFKTSASGGLQYADAKAGEGVPPESGSAVSIDYVMSTSGAARGTKLYSTTDPDREPYTFVLGDGSTIAGLEQAIAGSAAERVPPMLPGGVRRVVIAGSSPLGYSPKECAEGRGPGPTPRGETYQRFKNQFCNLQRPATPELVLDIKLLSRS